MGRDEPMNIIKKTFDLNSLGSTEALKPYKQEMGILVTLWRNRVAGTKGWETNSGFVEVSKWEMIGSGTRIAS